MNEIETGDGSNTLFSKEYNEHYHSTKDGAINESLYKHIIPAITHHKGKNSLKILDICFGLGYNTLATLYYIKQNALDISLEIYSPELDSKLLKNLQHFRYPKEFEYLGQIIDTISEKLIYTEDNIKIEVVNMDATKYVKTLKQKGIDIVYQDPFSYKVNTELWSKEFFTDIKNSMSKNAILTTYSVARVVKDNLIEAGFSIEKYKNIYTRSSTIAKN
jgi:tRNA U34 5-methylaminomethyl-2-thiouridine-forming methyltransferase MnmC